MNVTRRSLLAAAGAFSLSRGALGEPARRAFRTFELAVPTDAKGARRALVILPSALDPRSPLPLLVLLHGLGETSDEQAGTRAWLERYGLGRAWEGLQNPEPARARPSFLNEAEDAAQRQCLSRRPFAGLCVICPYLPHPRTFAASDPKFERYASWLSDALLPAVRDRVPEATRAPAQTGIAGVSLGGFVALQAGLLRAQHYATVGSVQGAFGVEQAGSLARRLSESFRGPGRSVYLATSQADPYRAANQALARQLTTLGVSGALCLRAGPHSQSWLREVGSSDLLLWHDRALRRAAGENSPLSSESCCGE
jgi:enterochelin esterase-like enzyme